MICGCHFKAGQAVPPAMIKAHFEHTREVLSFWQKIIGPHQDPATRMLLPQLNQEYLAFIDKLFTISQIPRL